MKKVLWSLLSLIVTVTTVNAASFDCGKASTKVEKFVCGNAELSRLDEDLSNAYHQALQRDDVKRSAIEGQRQWLKNERNACADVECIKEAYERRIKELGITSSFGISFMRPPPGSPVPTPPTAKLQERSVPVPHEIISPVAQPSPASAVDCGVLINPVAATMPKSGQVTQLIETSKADFEKQQFECAVRALEQANHVLSSVDDAAERAVTGFDIKDAVFAAIRQGTFPDPDFEKREIMAALQSVDANGALIGAPSEDERFNDAAFLGRLADYYLDHRRQDDYRRVSSMMLMVDATLPANHRFVDPSRMHRYLNVLAYKLEFMDLANLLDDAPDSMKNSLGKDIAYTIRQPINSQVLIGVTLPPPEKARQDVTALNKLLPYIEAAKSGQSDFWIWPIYRYLAEAYWQSGNNEKAREMINKSRMSILSAKSYPKGSSTALEYFATSLCKFIRIEIGKGVQMCPIGIYDAKEMAALFDEVEKVARLASDSHALATAGVLRKRLQEAAP